MNKPRLHYFEKEDILHLAIGEGEEARSVEIGNNITVELNAENELIGVEILNATIFMRDSVLESVQAKALDLVVATPA